MSLPKKLEEDGYIIIEELGNGGQSHTFIVDKKDSKALLKIHSSKNLSKEQRFRFKQEAEALQMLGGKGTPKVLNHSAEGDEPYIVMELIEGKTLGDVVNGKPLHIDRAISILTKLSKILSLVHEMGMQHRDIKPDNIIVSNDDDVTLIDFGLCRIENEDKTFKTPAGKELGNRFLRLPELGKGGKVSSSVSDVTFLTGILFYMLTGRQPNVLLDEHNLLPHQRPEVAVFFQNEIWLKLTFDKGFSYPIGQRFQTTDDLIQFLQEQKMKSPIIDKDDPIAELENLMNSPKQKSLNEIIGFIIDAHNIFIRSAQGAVGSRVVHGGNGPNADETGYSVITHFYQVPVGRSYPQVWWKIITSVDKDLNTISHVCDFSDENLRTATYSVSEKDRIFKEYQEYGEARAKEALKELVHKMKQNLA
jgi:serine/threonine protein kinase